MATDWEYSCPPPHPILWMYLFKEFRTFFTTLRWLVTTYARHSRKLFLWPFNIQVRIEIQCIILLCRHYLPGSDGDIGDAVQHHAVPEHHDRHQERVRVPRAVLFIAHHHRHISTH